MAFSAHYDGARDLLVGHGSGSVTAREIFDAFSAVVLATGGAAMHKDVLTIFDADCSLNELDFEGLSHLKAQIDALISRYHAGKAKSAIVAPADMQIRVLNLFKALVEADPDAEREVRVFLNETDALAWLREPV